MWRDVANKIADYLNVLLAVDWDIDAIDRVAKSRRVEDFLESLYNALRRKENLRERLRDAASREGMGEEQKRAVDYAIRRVDLLTPKDLEDLHEALVRNEVSVKHAASYIGCRALASHPAFHTLRFIFGGR